jgi:hypothetical protein
MSVHYTIAYLNTQARGGFRFFGFRRSYQREKCQKCVVDHAVVAMINTENPEDQISLCMLCYNKYPAEELLGRLS